jgi:hypothetical protein
VRALVGMMRGNVEIVQSCAVPVYQLTQLATHTLVVLDARTGNKDLLALWLNNHYEMQSKCAQYKEFRGGFTRKYGR